MSEVVEWKNCEHEEGGVPCDAPAHVTYYWPGKLPKLACLIHATQVLTVAHHAGFPVPTQPYRPLK